MLGCLLTRPGAVVAGSSISTTPAEVIRKMPDDEKIDRKDIGKGRFAALPSAAVRALATAKWRVPDDAPEAAAELAGEALERLVGIMYGKVSFRKAPSALKAAAMIREEICGPLTQKVEVKGSLSLADLVTKATAGDK